MATYILLDKGQSIGVDVEQCYLAHHAANFLRAAVTAGRMDSPTATVATAAQPKVGCPDRHCRRYRCAGHHRLRSSGHSLQATASVPLRSHDDGVLPCEAPRNSSLTTKPNGTATTASRPPTHLRPLPRQHQPPPPMLD
ncbi:unnamed protein product [Miscanthus lutarioriparius]|uniref:Uncharacterized protein n=1 Tax=Miscanthus lutarioriparius TaxID=422564 RepID=A0A811P4Y9_9POAL|nr:unnamed protein product [Miscanthus lutarioriparius]